MTDNAVSRLRNIHWLLAVQSLVIILGSINRLGTLTLSYVAANEFLRWVDLINMIVLPIISLTAFYLLKKQIEYDSPQRNRPLHLLLNVIFILGVYLLGASYGDHEVTNYLHSRFCVPDDGSDLCRIVIFNDDEFSHWLFFTGFVMVNGVLLLLQVLFQHEGALTRRDVVLLMINGVFIAAGIFANLAFEVIGADLYIVALLAILSVYLLWRYGRQPLLIYYTVAYWLGLVATFVVKLRG